MPVGAQGSRFKLYGKAQNSAGTAPGGNWDQFPFFSMDLVAQQDQTQDAVLSAYATRSNADPMFGLIRVQGSVRVPIDVVHFGRWLKMLLGAPTTTGAGPNYTHVFKDGAATLPFFAFEKAYLDVVEYEVVLDVHANTMAVQIAPDGTADATIGLLAVSDTPTVGDVSSAGTPVVTALTRFHKPLGSIEWDGAALGKVTGGDFTISNDMELVATVRDDYKMEGIDLGNSGATGTLAVRFENQNLRNSAVDRTPKVLRYGMTINANTSIFWRFPRAFLSVQGAPVEGPRGITQNFRWTAAYDESAACAVEVTLKNQTASYA